MTDFHELVKSVCLMFPEAEEVPSRGSPDFRVHKKTFATYVLNHHGDQRIALWLNVGREVQGMYCDSRPRFFFVPPYVGPRGWVGLHLNQGMPWSEVAHVVLSAYRQVVPDSLLHQVSIPDFIEPPDHVPTIEEIDPLCTDDNQARLARIREICLALPETVEGQQFGTPAWKAGKKTFCTVSNYGNGTHLQAWVGAERQAGLTLDKRYTVPAYTGHNGWINLDLEAREDWDEVRELALESYRHFALKRMLKAIGEA